MIPRNPYLMLVLLLATAGIGLAQITVLIPLPVALFNPGWTHLTATTAPKLRRTSRP